MPQKLGLLFFRLKLKAKKVFVDKFLSKIRIPSKDFSNLIEQKNQKIITWGQNMNKIEVNALRKAHEGIKGYETAKIEINGKEPIGFQVKKYLTFHDFRQFVQEMAELQFATDYFSPENASIVFDIGLCNYYTNLELPEDAVEAYEIIHSLGIKDKILSVVQNSAQYKSLIESIVEAQSFTLAQRTGINGLLASITKAVDEFDPKAMLDAFKEFNPETLKHLSELKELSKIFSAPQSKQTASENTNTANP